MSWLSTQYTWSTDIYEDENAITIRTCHRIRGGGGILLGFISAAILLLGLISAIYVPFSFRPPVGEAWLWPDILGASVSGPLIVLALILLFRGVTANFGVRHHIFEKITKSLRIDCRLFGLTILSRTIPTAKIKQLGWKNSTVVVTSQFDQPSEKPSRIMVRGCSFWNDVSIEPIRSDEVKTLISRLLVTLGRSPEDVASTREMRWRGDRRATLAPLVSFLCLVAIIFTVAGLNDAAKTARFRRVALATQQRRLEEQQRLDALSPEERSRREEDQRLMVEELRKSGALR